MVSDWIKSLGKWLSTHKKAIGTGGIILAILGIISILYCFTDIFSIIIKYLKQHSNTNDINVITSVAIGTIVSIMAIAFPVVINVMHNLSMRYQNNYVVTIFQNRIELKVFKYSLYVSLGLSASWLFFYFFDSASFFWDNFFMYLLCIATVFVVISLLVLIWKIVAFMTPTNLVEIIKEEIDSLHTPSYYFSPDTYIFLEYGSNEENERLKRLSIIEDYDDLSTQPYVAILRIYALFPEDFSARKRIQKFWQEKCRKASCIIDNTKHYTKSYYNFIFASLDWAIDKNDYNSQEDAIMFLNTLFNAHLPVPQKFGEPEKDIHKIQYELSNETIEFIWKTMVKCINCSTTELFQKYWQRATNFYARKFQEHFEIPGGCPVNGDIKDEKSLYYAIHYLCCSYLIGYKKFNLLDYALNYSQSMPFRWYLIPNNIEDTLRTYVTIKEWYENIDISSRFPLTDDPNLFDRMNIEKPIEQFTCLLLLLLWHDDDDNSSVALNLKWNTDRYLEILKLVVNNITSETDWIKYFHMEEFLTKKESIVKWLENLTSKTQ